MVGEGVRLLNLSPWPPPHSLKMIQIDASSWPRSGLSDHHSAQARLTSEMLIGDAEFQLCFVSTGWQLVK